MEPDYLSESTWEQSLERIMLPSISSELHVNKHHTCINTPIPLHRHTYMITKIL